TSFDEVIVILFIGGPDQRTVPRQMWSGIRDSIDPSILAVATMHARRVVAGWEKYRSIRENSESIGSPAMSKESWRRCARVRARFISIKGFSGVNRW
ncbi:hypothetical protein ACRXB1_20785, partial [Caballeronia sp. M23-90]